MSTTATISAPAKPQNSDIFTFLTYDRFKLALAAALFRSFSCVRTVST
jgi:hypothetical protein